MKNLEFVNARKNPTHPDFGKWNTQRYIFFLKNLIIRFNDIWDGKVIKQFIEKYGVLSNYIIFK